MYYDAKELVIAALNHEETTTIPYHIDFTGQSLEQLIAYTGNRDIGGAAGGVYELYPVLGMASEIDGRPGYFRMNLGLCGTGMGLIRILGWWRSLR